MFNNSLYQRPYQQPLREGETRVDEIERGNRGEPGRWNEITGRVNPITSNPIYQPVNPIAPPPAFQAPIQTPQAPQPVAPQPVAPQAPQAPQAPAQPQDELIDFQQWRKQQNKFWPAVMVKDPRGGGGQVDYSYAEYLKATGQVGQNWGQPVNPLFQKALDITGGQQGQQSIVDIIRSLLGGA